ncbi:MAG: NUDIX domain-containing protein [Campylobacter sp.]
MDTVIKDIKISKLIKPKYVNPYQLSFTMGGKPIVWECIKAYDSVSALLYHEQKDAFLLVKQFRPAVWYNLQSTGKCSEELGYTYELCAGLMDKSKSEEQTIREEILEEVGYLAKDITKIVGVFGALGFSGNKQTMFFATINDSMKVNDGGGVDNEQIELIYLPVSQAREFMFDENKIKAIGLLFAFMWFFDKFKR